MMPVWPGLQMVEEGRWRHCQQGGKSGRIQSFSNQIFQSRHTSIKSNWDTNHIQIQGDTSCRASSQAVLIQNYFLINNAYVKIFATLATNAVNWEEMRENQWKKRKWREREEMESEEISLCLHFLPLSPFPLSLHFLIISRFPAAWLPGCRSLWQPVYISRVAGVGWLSACATKSL